MVGRGGLVAAPPPHGGTYGVRLSPPPSCVVDRARLPASGLESVGPLVARPRMAGGCARRRLGCRLRHAGPPAQESGDFSSPEPSRQHAAQLGRHPLPMGLCGRQRRSHSLRDHPSLTTEDYCLSSQSQTSFWPHWPALAADCARPAPHRSPSPCAPHAAPPLCDEIGLRAERHSDGGRCQPPELHLGSSAMRDSCAFSRGRRCGFLHMSFWKAPVFPAASSQWADLVGAAHPTSVSHAAVSHTFARRMQVRRDGRRGAATFCVSATCAEHRGSGDPRGRTGGRT